MEMVAEAMLVTVRVAVLLAVPAVGVCAVVTPEVVLLLPPSVLLVTVKVTVQLGEGIVIPVKLRAVAPASKEDGVVPPQVPPTAPATALMLVRVSVNAPPDKAIPLLFDRVRVTRELPPDTIEVGLNALEMVGAANTVRMAELLGDPAVGVCVVVTPEVVLLLEPTVLLVTLTVTVQLPLAGTLIDEKPKKVAPKPTEVGRVPEQVPPTAPPAAVMPVRVSVNAPPVRAVVALLLIRVKVTTELPPD